MNFPKAGKRKIAFRSFICKKELKFHGGLDENVRPAPRMRVYGAGLARNGQSAKAESDHFVSSCVLADHAKKMASVEFSNVRGVPLCLAARSAARSPATPIAKIALSTLICPRISAFLISHWCPAHSNVHLVRPRVLGKVSGPQLPGERNARANPATSRENTAI